MKQIIGLKEFRLNTQAIADKVQRGQSFVVFKRSKPIFAISPVPGETWETIVDFTKINKNGVPADKVLKALRRLIDKGASS